MKFESKKLVTKLVLALFMMAVCSTVSFAEQAHDDLSGHAYCATIEEYPIVFYFKEDGRLFFVSNESIGEVLKVLSKKNVSENEILELMGVTSDGLPTLAGLMTFSKYPQTYFPQLCITAVSLPGTEMGSTGTDGERFIDNKRITGAIPDMLDEAVEFVRKNSRTKTIIDDNGKRADKKKKLFNANLPCGLYCYFGKPPKTENLSKKNP